VEEEIEKPETNTNKGVGSDFIYIYWDYSLPLLESNMLMNRHTVTVLDMAFTQIGNITWYKLNRRTCCQQQNSTKSYNSFHNLSY
jgi:hypothetical protein